MEYNGEERNEADRLGRHRKMVQSGCVGLFYHLYPSFARGQERRFKYRKEKSCKRKR